MALPESIKIGGFIYRVEIGTDDVGLAERSHSAETNHKKQIIVFASGYVARRPKSLLHELLHCMTEITDLDREWGDKEETYVERIGGVLFAIFKDNPDLLRYWLED